MEKTITYYRVSTKKEKQLHSLEEQKNFLKKYISKYKELELVEILNNKLWRN